MPIFYRSESNLQSTKPNIIKNMLVRILVKISKALLFIGNENKKYYKYFGASESKLFFTPYAVDNDFFDEKCAFTILRRTAPGEPTGKERKYIHRK